VLRNLERLFEPNNAAGNGPEIFRKSHSQTPGFPFKTGISSNLTIDTATSSSFLVSASTCLRLPSSKVVRARRVIPGSNRCPYTARPAARVVCKLTPAFMIAAMSA
jgi:hypothetical protein